MAEQERALMRKFYLLLQQGWRTGDFTPLWSVAAPDAQVHMSGVLPGTEAAGLMELLPMFRAAFPDLEATVEFMISEADLVADRVTWRATHRGAVMGVPASGKQVTVSELHMQRISSGKVVERWVQWDVLGVMRQMGLAPADPGGASRPAPDPAPVQMKRRASAVVTRNKELVCRLLEEAVNNGVDRAVDELVAPSCVNHDLAGLSLGSEGFRQSLATLRVGFPDLRLTVEDALAEGDLVCTRGFFQGTHQGPFRGLAPTGKQATVAYIDAWRVAGRKAVERWVQMDMLALMPLRAVPTLV